MLRACHLLIETLIKNAAIQANFVGGVLLHGVDPKLAENEIAVLKAAADDGKGTGTGTDSAASSLVLEAAALDSDLVAGKYEGGMKV